MKVEILGTGCKKCKTLEEMIREIDKEYRLNSEIIKITDIDTIIEYGVMLTPGLVIDGEIKVSGRLPTKKEVRDFLNIIGEN